MKTAYSYIRFSTPTQDLGDSERRQLALAKAWCDRNDYVLSDVCFADRGVSAYHGKHREKGRLGDLLKRVKAGDVILIEDTTRWSREDPLDAMIRLREEARKGIEIVFLRTGVRVTKDNFNDLAVLLPNFINAVLGNAENISKGVKVKANWEQRKALAASGVAINSPSQTSRSGVLRFNRPPCWLEWDSAAKKLVVNEDKAKVVRRIFKLATEGHGVKAITRQLKVTPPITTSKKQNRRWHATVVRRLLSDKAVAGFYMQANPPTAGVWPVVVDEKTFCVAQARLNFTKRQTRPAHSQVNLFTGLCKCKRCGSNLVAHMSDNPGRSSRLVCGGASMGKTDCDFSSVPLEMVEKSILGFLAESDSIRPVLAAKSNKPSKLEELEAERAAAQKLVTRLTQAMTGDTEPPADLYAKLKSEDAKAKQLAIDIEAERIRVKGETPALQSYLDFCSRLPSLGKDKARRPELRRAIASVVESITLDPRGKNGVWWSSLQLKGNARRFEIMSGLAAQLHRMGN